MIIQHLESLAHLSASLQAPYSRIAKAVESLGVKPAVTINGIPHFDGESCERIAEHLQAEPRTKTKTRVNTVSPGGEPARGAS
jgi:hypothetical protein